MYNWNPKNLAWNLPKVIKIMGAERYQWLCSAIFTIKLEYVYIFQQVNAGWNKPKNADNPLQ